MVADGVVEILSLFVNFRRNSVFCFFVVFYYYFDLGPCNFKLSFVAVVLINVAVTQARLTGSVNTESRR